MAFIITSEHMLVALRQELNNRYGKGEIYKNYDYHFGDGETYTHVTEDRIKRTFEIDKFALKYGKGDPIRLIEEDHSHHCPEMDSYARTRAERDAMEARHVIKQGFEPKYGWEDKQDKPKKKSKRKDGIRERLQKETDSWLKSVQKEED